MLTKEEKRKFETIKNIVEGKLDKESAQKELKLTRRQVNRLIIKYNTENEEGFSHKNKGKTNKNKISEKKIKEIIDLYLKEYSDYNFTHFYDEVGETINISYSSLSRIFRKEEIISPEAHHKTVKLYNAEMKKSIKENNIDKERIKLYNLRQEQEKEKHFRKSNLHFNFGQQIQMDAAFAIWFGTEETALHLAIDKATKKVLSGVFEEQETTNAYYTLLIDIVLKYGIPKIIRTDKRGSFSLNDIKRKKSKLNTTQFGAVCDDLEIELESKSNPLFKPNVERANKTFKGRLKAELRKAKITELKSANKYLNEIFIPKINAKFSYPINEEKNDMRKNTYTKEELNMIFSKKYYRLIDNASSIKYLNNYYLIIDNETGEIMSYKQGTNVTIIVAYDGSLYGQIDERIYILYKIEQRKLSTCKPKSSKTQEEINRSKAHKPSPNNPWLKFKI